MARAQREEIFNIDINKFYNILIDYLGYKDFVDGVSEVKVLEQTETDAKVEFSINLIKNFRYVLKMTQKRPSELTWTLEWGDLFKKNEGRWSLKDLGDGKIKVLYELEVEFKGFAPRPVINKLVSHNLPNMMQSYYQRAKSKG